MTEIDVLGITTRREIRWGSGFCIMGFGDIALPQMEITLRGCALARSSGRIIALPPKLPGAHPGDLGAIQWNANGQFGMRVRDALLAAYQKMGGEMPPDHDDAAQERATNAARRIAEKRRDHVTGKPIGPDPFAVDPERATKHRPDDMPADALEQAAKAAAHARRHAVARAEAVAADARRHAVARTATDEDDDVSGLHRTLRVCAVEETMEKAGL